MGSWVLYIAKHISVSFLSTQLIWPFPVLLLQYLIDGFLNLFLHLKQTTFKSSANLIWTQNVQSSSSFNEYRLKLNKGLLLLMFMIKL